MAATWTYVALILLASHAANALQSSLGSTVRLTSGVTVVDYGTLGSGPTLTISLSAAANVTLSAGANIGDLPVGYEGLSFSVAGGSAQFALEFDVQPSSAFVSASLETGALLSAAITLLAQVNVRSAFLQFDAELESYNQLEWDLSGSTSLSAELPVSGTTYVFAAYDIGSVIPSFFGTYQQVEADVEASIQYPEGFGLIITADSDTSVVVEESDQPADSTAPEGYVSLDVYWSIDISNSASFVANLTYSFEQAALEAKGVVADSLAFAYYNAGEFVIDGNASVDTETGVVTQGTSHFSQWGVYGRPDTSSTSSPSSQASKIAGMMSVMFALVLLLL
eukprot:TRINITY_DN615_c0_g1_i1.p1 TRINITY_DN615_c0_g1~~TRINITY_DN615_c0_g1_i1.p1  ORF type:complete len:337 (-),score=88.70 TRINITY_DN615_c0_g1_i1:45-1055(-)